MAYESTSPQHLTRYGMIARVRRMVGGVGDGQWALADQAIVSGANFLTGVLIARVLGAEEFGRYALAWLGLFISLNIHVALVILPMMTFGASRPARLRPVYLGAMLAQHAAITVTIALAVTACCLVSTLVYPEWGLGELAVALAVVVLATLSAEFMRTYYYATTRARLSVCFDLTRCSLQVLLVFAALHLAPRTQALDFVLWAMAAASAAVSLLFAPLVGAAVFKSKSMAIVCARHWNFARWTLASIGIMVLRDAVTGVAVGAYLGVVDVGLLRATQQIVQVVNVPLYGLGRLALPHASLTFAQHGIIGLLRYIKGFVIPYMGAIAVLLVLLALNGEWLITTVYGSSYAGSGTLLSVYAVALMFYLLRETTLIIARSIRIPSAEFYAVIAAAVLALVVAVPMLRIFGLVGAAMCDVLFFGIGFVVMAARLRSSVPLSAFWASSAKPK